jgi:predicted alpha/beta hydrolase family esterase
MPTEVLFIHSAGPQSGEQGSAPLLKHLRHDLGPGFRIHAPHMPGTDEPSSARWQGKLGELLSADVPPRILVGHSLGASELLKYLSGHALRHPPGGLFLVATPFWKREEFALQPGFAHALPQALQVWLYQGRDDEQLDASHLSRYAEVLPRATARLLDRGGHTFPQGLQELARDLAAFAGAGAGA